MKMKITPDTTTVRSILTERISEAEGLLAADDAELAEKVGGKSLIYNSFNETDMRVLKNTISNRTQYLKDRRTELALLDAHQDPKVMVEIDL